MSTSDIHILSTGTALPGSAIDNAALGKRFGMDALWEQWVDTFVGTKSRYLSFDLDSGEPFGRLADLGETAGRAALSAAGVEPGDIDAVVLGTATPDMLMPATVNVIADRLEIDAVPTYQLQSGCTGAVQALALARHLLRDDGIRTVLVLAGDTCTKYFDMDADYSELPPAELINLVLFGDGAGAAVLSSEPRPGAPVLREVFTRLVGGGLPPGHELDWFGPADKHEERPGVTEDYKAVEHLVPGLAGEVLGELLERLEWSAGEVDFLLPPQLSGRMTERIVAGLGMAEAEEVTCVAEVGNSGNALPFLQLDRLLTRMADGDRAVGVAIESSKWIKGGFAVERVA
ncbi:3-oxoacyl-[acyl-carrier-protein] synthase-3 [Sinosporangium album]|uniref:3-oxoacyl-[acyl-carrier-protein] synthase-3 n=1 Tax=Sinosporangium album TaxID=504805 RepID=A0A1G7YD31_9ACTN|nr:3-oxoacyl-ACP synthase III family protein [Sinosporangium album]SDG94462.1 3-oxoacyl-[acyl-carrier-protein] synthase-3 [Sinosporangium album]